MKWLGVSLALAAVLAGGSRQPAAITVDYPEQGSIFPPEITPPAFLWRDPVEGASVWRIEVRFADGAAAVRTQSRGEPLPTGEIDPRTVSDTNQPPKWNPQIAAARSWTPDAAVWETIKKHSVKRPATITITGHPDEKSKQAVSRGQVTIQTSRDPVGAPIFYRDVPLMPSELEKGIIKPLAQSAVPLIGWRLRDVGEPRSRLLMTGLRTCANCHSFSRDGKTLGMDLDGPRNDKGLYALAPISKEMSIRNEDVIAWSSFAGKLGGNLRVGFMSQVSPDGQYVVTMIDRPETVTATVRRRDPRVGRRHFYVANFKDYRFLQVFYPTRGVLAWYSRRTGALQLVPGADDPRFVHTGAFWTPDGKYLIFSRAEAKEPYPEGAKLAEFANDPNESQIRYDLYRIPFNDGKGGAAEPIAGASRNGMSNAFPKVSPDGRWIVFVQARNGLLMRPDSQLYIVPAAGGEARRMRCNTALMNSWHSFSPNGRWMVFSSKSRRPYTQMFLTHIDEQGNDSPPVLIDNATAANRAVNIPEFVNLPADGLAKIEIPATEYYQVFDRAWELAGKGQYDDAAIEWKRAVAMNPDDPKAYMNLGVTLVRAGKTGEAVPYYRKALEIDPEYAEAHNDLGVALAGEAKLEEAIAHYRKALEIDPDYSEVHNNFGAALARSGRLEEAIAQFDRALEANPRSPDVLNNLGRALAQTGRFDDAIARFEKVVAAAPDFAEAHNSLGVALVWKRRAADAVAQFQKALEINPGYVEAHYNLGDTLYYLLGKTAEGVAHWREVLRIQPRHLPVLSQLARALATSRDDSFRNGAEAVVLAERAAELSGGQDAMVLDTLAAAFGEAGRYREALDAARRGLAIAGERGQPSLIESLKSRIALYESKTSQ